MILLYAYSASIPKSTIVNEKCMEITSVTVSVLSIKCYKNKVHIYFIYLFIFIAYAPTTYKKTGLK